MLTKSKGHVYPVFLRFPQPEDAAGADLQTRLLDAADVRFLFLIRVCGADGGEMALRRFQIAVDALAACRLQRLQLLFGQKSERAADGELRLFADPLHRFYDGSKLHGIALPATGGDDAEAFCAIDLCLFGFAEQILRAS